MATSIKCDSCCDGRFSKVAKRRRTLKKCHEKCKSLPTPTNKPSSTLRQTTEASIDPDICRQQSADWLQCNGCCRQFLGDSNKSYGCKRKCIELQPKTTPKPATRRTTRPTLVTRNPSTAQCGVASRSIAQSYDCHFYSTVVVDGHALHRDERPLSLISTSGNVLGSTFNIAHPQCSGSRRRRSDDDSDYYSSEYDDDYEDNFDGPLTIEVSSKVNTPDVFYADDGPADVEGSIRRKHAKEWIKETESGHDIVSMKVVNGVVVNAGELPWMISIRDNDGFAFCGGTIITPEYSVTAAHCKEFTNLRYYMITSGHTQRSYRRSKSEVGFQESKLSKFENHPKYDGVELVNDFAVLQMATPFKLTDYVMPACLVKPNFEFTEQVQCLVSGWGNTARWDHMDDYDDNMQKAVVSYFSPTQCNQKNNNDFVLDDGTQFCFGSTIQDRDRVTDSCQGDSGGPVQCMINGAWTIVGVVSYGGNCAEVGKAAVYTRLASPKIRSLIEKYL